MKLVQDLLPFQQELLPNATVNDLIFIAVILMQDVNYLVKTKPTYLSSYSMLHDKDIESSAFKCFCLPLPVCFLSLQMFNTINFVIIPLNII